MQNHRKPEGGSIPFDPRAERAIRHRRYVIPIAVVLIFLAVNCLIPMGRIGYTFHPEDMTITFSDSSWLVERGNWSFSLRYDEIAEVTLVSELGEAGTCLDGTETSRFLGGEWKNEVYGTYTICAYKNVNSFILIEDLEREIYIFNLKNAFSTEECWLSLRDLAGGQAKV